MGRPPILPFCKENLSGAVFQVIASEDIITLDGTIRANAGDVVAEITTDETGMRKLIFFISENTK